MKNKHAFLIIAHTDDFCFRTLLRQLDNTRNDIYIHMDKKNVLYNPDEIESYVNKAHVYHIDRKSVSWGGYSLIDTELRLIEAACKMNEYQYLHLVSGADLLIKPLDYFYSFFEVNYGKEFVAVKPVKNAIKRVNTWYFFQEKIGRRNDASLICKVNRLVQKLIKCFGITRSIDVSFYFGSQWFSISENFAKYVIQNRKRIKKIFKYTHCADEIFLQTIIVGSKFEKEIYNFGEFKSPEMNMRLIDWKRGDPYVWRYTDLNEILQSDKLIIRKIDSRDCDLIKAIYKNTVSM